MDYTLWINKAIVQLRTISTNTEFVLKDLYLGTGWNELSGGEKRDLGRRFKHYVITGQVSNVVFIGRAENNSSKYRKTGGNQ